MKPEIIFFSQYKLGGVQNYYYNLIRNLPPDIFDYKWILLQTEGDMDALPVENYNVPNIHIIQIGSNEPPEQYAGRIKELISDRPGMIMTNLPAELLALHHGRIKNKAIVFVCHDEVYLPIAIHFAPIIDIFIAHNPQFHAAMRDKMPGRTNDVYYLPFGIELPEKKRVPVITEGRRLEVVFLGRLHRSKGIFDIIEIDEILKQNNVSVNWTIIGDGPEKENFTSQIKDFPNFVHKIVKGGNVLFDELSTKDIFVLPSYLDGMPVSIMETTSCALVPIIYQFNDGIVQVVTNDIGFIIKSGDRKAFAESIIALHKDRKSLLRLSENCINKAYTDFDIHRRIADYITLFKDHEALLRNSSKEGRLVTESGRLDTIGLPVFVVNMIRRSKRFVKGILQKDR